MSRFRTGNNPLFRISFSQKTKKRGQQYPSVSWKQAEAQAHELGDAVYAMLRQTGFYTTMNSHENNDFRMYGDRSRVVRTITAGRGRPNTQVIVRVIRNPEFTEQSAEYNIGQVVDSKILAAETAIERTLKLATDPRSSWNHDNIAYMYACATGRRDARSDRPEFSAVAQLDYIFPQKLWQDGPRAEILSKLYQDFSLRDALFKYSLAERILNRVGEKTFAVFRLFAKPFIYGGDCRDYFIYSGTKATSWFCPQAQLKPVRAYR